MGEIFERKRKEIIFRALNWRRNFLEINLFEELFSSMDLSKLVCLICRPMHFHGYVMKKVFSRVHATLQPALSVRPSIRQSVRHILLSL